MARRLGRTYARAVASELGTAAPAWQFSVVPHTHWDREWYRPFEYFQLALGRVVDGVIDVLERNPDFTSFTLDGQAIVLEDYLEIRPENEARLRRLIEAGRIEIGPSYMLPDEFLVGAEPLVRNLLIGRAVCRRFGAEPTPTGYLPDSFGHPLQLPQILAGFGIRSFVFSRGMGDELESVGAVFRWRAPDGSEVLALQQLDHYGNFAFVPDAQDGAERARALVERFGGLLERAEVDRVLLCNGTDHVPINPGLPAMCAEMERLLPGSSFTITKYCDYVAAVEEVDVPAWSRRAPGQPDPEHPPGGQLSRLYVKQATSWPSGGCWRSRRWARCERCRGIAFSHHDFDLGLARLAASPTTRSAAARAMRSIATPRLVTNRCTGRSACSRTGPLPVCPSPRAAPSPRPWGF